MWKCIGCVLCVHVCTVSWDRVMVCGVCTCVYCVVRSCNGVWCEVCTVCAVWVSCVMCGVSAWLMLVLSMFTITTCMYVRMFRKNCLLQWMSLQASLRGNWQCEYTYVCESLTEFGVCMYVSAILGEGILVWEGCLFVVYPCICLFVVYPCICLFAYRQEAEVQALSDDVDQRNTWALYTTCVLLLLPITVTDSEDNGVVN